MIGSKCFLSPVEEDDAEAHFRWHNDLEITTQLGYAHVATTDERERRHLKKRLKNNPHAFSIVDLQTDRLIGMVNLHGIDPINRSAFLGIVIGEKEYWSRGYGTEAITLILDYGFNILNLHSVGLGVIAFNEQAIACYKKVGFKEAGRKRESKFMFGKPHDVVLMDVLAGEFQSQFVPDILRYSDRGRNDDPS